jgi:hypothetical protein
LSGNKAGDVVVELNINGISIFNAFIGMGKLRKDLLLWHYVIAI